MEAAPPLPPVLEVEGALRAWEERELGELRAALGEARWYAELVEEVGEGPAEEALRYVASKYMVPGLKDYYLELIEATRGASLRGSRLGRRFVEELKRRGKAAVDWFVRRFLGVRPYAGLLAPLSATPLGIVPAPPEGLPSVAGPYEPGHYFADAEAAQTLTVKPAAAVAGPLFFTRRNHSWEVRFDGRGRGAVVVWLLWELIFCILFRFWVPVKVWSGATPGVARFTVSIPYTYVTAYAVQPVAAPRVAVTLRKVV